MKYILIPLVLFFSHSVLADAEDYQVEDCEYNSDYQQNLTLQPGDEITFQTNHETIFAPSGQSVVVYSQNRIDTGSPYQTPAPDRDNFNSVLVLRNRSSELLRMSEGHSQTLTVVGQSDRIGRDVMVQSQNGFSFSLDCDSRGPGVDFSLGCSLNTLIGHFPGITVTRNNQTLTSEDLAEMQNCNSEPMVIQEAGLQTTNNQNTSL